MYALELENHTCIPMSSTFTQILELNLDPHACQTGILPTEPFFSSIDSFLKAYLKEAINNCEMRGHR